MTKSELSKTLAERLNLNKTDAEKVVNTFFDVMAAGLRDGRRIELRRFGSFAVKDYDGYMGRNPRTGEQVAVAPKRLPIFRVSGDLREEVGKIGSTDNV